jgi:hypothetical protein
MGRFVIRRREFIIKLVDHGDNRKCDFLKDITSQQINEDKIRRARASQKFNGQEGIKPKPIRRRRMGR